METLRQLIDGSRSTVHLDGRAYAAATVLAAADEARLRLHRNGFRHGDGLVVIDEGSGFDTLATVLGAWAAGIHVAITPGPEHDLSPLLTATGARLESSSGSVGIDRWSLAARPDDIAWDVASSGTTGTPKVVGFSHAAICANVRGIAERLALGPLDHVYTPLPLSLPGVLGMVVLPAMLAHADVTVTGLPGPEVLLARSQIRQIRPTVVYGVPYLFDVLSRGPSLDGTDRLRLLVSSSAPMPRETFDRVHAAFGVPPRSSYCSAETATVSICDAENLDEVRSGCGRPLSGLVLTVTSDDANGDTGRITVSGSSLGSGYWRQGTLESFANPMSFATNDLGRLTDGCLHLHSRVDDVIQVAGRNVDLANVRRILADVPRLGEHAVVVEEDGLLGVVPVLLVVSGDDVPDAREILSLCRAQLSPSETPRRVRFVDALPRSASGKVRTVLTWAGHE